MSKVKPLKKIKRAGGMFVLKAIVARVLEKLHLRHPKTEEIAMEDVTKALEGLGKQIAEATQPVFRGILQGIQREMTGVLQQQLDQAIEPVREAMHAQIEEALQPIREQLQHSLDEALEPMRKQLEEQMEGVLRPLQEQLENQMKEAIASSLH